MANGSVIHFEIPFDDAERAQKFYQKAFGWKTRPMPEMGYTTVQTTPSDKDGRPTEAGAINGGMAQRNTTYFTHPVVTIGVADIDATLMAVEKGGGSIVSKKTAIGPMGFIAYFKDSEGNTVGLWQSPAMAP